MRTITSTILFWGVLLLFGLRPGAFCQMEDLPDENAAPPAKTRVRIESANAIPGASFSTPVYFTPGKGAAVGRLKIEVNFVSANLKFVKLDHGLLVEKHDLELKSELKTDQNEKGVETSTVMILASFPSAASPKEGISDGVLAYLVFRVDEKGRPAKIALRVDAEATDLKTNKPMQNLQALNAEVDVYAPGNLPTVTCFFFSH